MNWPQITWLVLAGMYFGACVVMHGKPKTGKYNAVSTLISIAIEIWLLRAGGFFQ
jgi:hypothetical protein